MEKSEYSWQGFKEYLQSMVDDHTSEMMKDRDWYINNTDPEYNYPDSQVRLDAIKNVLDAVQHIFKDELDKTEELITNS